MTDIATIRRIVCQRYGVSFVDLDSRRQDPATLEARYLGMWLARFVTPASIPEIGKRFGGRDQSTVRNAVLTIDRRMAIDPPFAAEMRMLRSVLMPSEPEHDERYQPVIPGVYVAHH